MGTILMPPISIIIIGRAIQWVDVNDLDNVENEQW